MINLTEKLKIVMWREHVTQKTLANRSQQTQNNLANKLKLNNFKLSEYEKLVEAMGCTLEVTIVMPNGDKI
jgi:hypothetical protein